MAATVTDMNGKVIRDREMNKDALKAVMVAKSLIEAGEVVGVAIVMQYADNAVAASRGGYLQHYPVVGVLEAIKHKLLTDE